MKFFSVAVEVQGLGEIAGLEYGEVINIEPWI